MSTSRQPNPQPPRRTGLLVALAVVMVAGVLVAALASFNPDGLGGLLASVRRGLSADSGALVQLGAPREDLEGPAIEAVNAARAAHGLPPVQFNPLLGEVARSRSVDMAVNHYFSHTTPDGKDIFLILDEAAYPWATAGENLYMSPSRDAGSIQQAMDFWTTSPTHAANLFSPSFTEAAIGVAEGDEGVYLTLVMGQQF